MCQKGVTSIGTLSWRQQWTRRSWCWLEFAVHRYNLLGIPVSVLVPVLGQVMFETNNLDSLNNENKGLVEMLIGIMVVCTDPKETLLFAASTTLWFTIKPRRPLLFGLLRKKRQQSCRQLIAWDSVPTCIKTFTCNTQNYIYVHTATIIGIYRTVPILSIPTEWHANNWYIQNSTNLIHHYRVACQQWMPAVLQSLIKLAVIMKQGQYWIAMNVTIQ